MFPQIIWPPSTHGPVGGTGPGTGAGAGSWWAGSDGGGLFGSIGSGPMGDGVSRFSKYSMDGRKRNMRHSHYHVGSSASQLNRDARNCAGPRNSPEHARSIEANAVQHS